jgi:hypothetical protein
LRGTALLEIVARVGGVAEVLVRVDLHALDVDRIPPDLLAITTGRAMTAPTIHTIVLVAMAAPSFVRSLETAPSLAAFR